MFLFLLQNLYIPLTLRTAEGSMNAIPSVLVLDKSFPVSIAIVSLRPRMNLVQFTDSSLLQGKLTSCDLKVHSSFGHYMEVRTLTFQPNDSRFYFVPPKDKPVLIQPNHDNIVSLKHSHLLHSEE